MQSVGELKQEYRVSTKKMSRKGGIQFVGEHKTGKLADIFCTAANGPLTWSKSSQISRDSTEAHETSIQTHEVTSPCRKKILRR